MKQRLAHLKSGVALARQRLGLRQSSGALLSHGSSKAAEDCRSPKSGGMSAASVLAVALLLAPRAAQACTVCFGNSDSKLTQGMLAGVLVLLLVVLSVLGGFVALFVYLARRAAATAALENQSTATDSIPNS